MKSNPGVASVEGGSPVKFSFSYSKFSFHSWISSSLGDMIPKSSAEDTSFLQSLAPKAAVGPDSKSARIIQRASAQDVAFGWIVKSDDCVALLD